jgi:hypothetical protein
MGSRKASAPDTVRTVTEGQESEQPAGRFASTNSRNHRRAQGWGGARVSGQQPARAPDNPDSNQPLVIVVEPVGHRGRFQARVDGRVLVASSRTPFCDAARALLAEGVDPAARIEMRHAGSSTNALASTVGGAAKVKVEEGDRVPYFRRWRPSLMRWRRQGSRQRTFPLLTPWPRRKSSPGRERPQVAIPETRRGATPRR